MSSVVSPSSLRLCTNERFDMRMARTSELPEEVVEEILSWLAPESVVRMKCVQKSWNILINSAAFVTKHFQNNKIKNSTAATSFVFRLLTPPYGPRRWNRVHNVLTLHHDAGANFSIEDFDFPRVIQRDGGKAHWHILSGYHCNGIIFLVNRKVDKVLLCNPAIKEMKILRNSCFRSGFSTLVLGFGHDFVTGTYKVVRIVRPRDGGRCCRAEVCVLGGGGGDDCWRETTAKLKIEIEEGPILGHDLFSLGICYWLVSDFTKKEMVLWFDVHTEEFGTIDLPTENNREPSSQSLLGWMLTLWKEHVILFMYSCNSWIPKPLEMWTMVGRKSWMEHRTIAIPESLVLYPLAFSNTDQLLLMDQKRGVVSYDLRSREFKTLDIVAGVGGIHGFVYSKSLVSLNRMTQT